MQSLFEDTPLHAPEDGPVMPEGDFAQEEHEVAGEAWELVRLVQQGRAEGATPHDIREGDEAFAAIYDRYYDTIFSTVLHRVKYDYALAEDITTDTFLRAFKGVENISWQGKSLSSWLTTIAGRLVIDHYRKIHTRMVIGTLDDDIWPRADQSPMGQPEATVLGHERRDELLDAIKRLSPDQQVVVALRYLEEKSIAETAEHLGKTEASIKALAHRGINALREIMKSDQDVPDVSSAADDAGDAFDGLVAAQPTPSEAVLPLDDWEGPSLLNTVGPGRAPYSAYTGAARHKLLPPERLEELAGYVAQAHKAQSQLQDANHIRDGEQDSLQAIIERGIQARRIIAAHNLRFAVRVAMKYRYAPAETDDIIQVANIGLIRAVDKYDPHYSSDTAITPFTTGAHGRIRGAILRHLLLERRARTTMGPADPESLELLQRSYEEARRQGYAVSHEDVGEWLGFSQTKVQELLGGVAARRVITMDLDSNEGLDAAGSIVDTAASFDFWQAEYNLTAEAFWDYLGKHLTERECFVLREHYVNEKTQDAIARDMVYSRQNITKIIAKAHHKIKVLFEEGPGALEVLGPQKVPEKRPHDSSLRLFRKLGIVTPEDADTSALRAWLMRKIDSLNVTKSAKNALSWHYGLESGGQGMTQEQIASRLGCSKRQVAVLEDMVLQPLKAWAKGDADITSA